MGQMALQIRGVSSLAQGAPCANQERYRIQRRTEEVRGGFNTNAIWREPPNHWRAITRLDVAVQVTALVPPRTVRLNQHHLAEPTMNRDDVLVWLSLTWFVALCGTAIWMLSRPACHVFGIG
jgi:hypothetical protein